MQLINKPGNILIEIVKSCTKLMMSGLACTTFNVRTEEIDQFGKLIGSGIISCSISPSFQDLISGHLIKNFLLKLLIIIYFRVINQQYQSPIKSHDVSLPIVMNGIRILTIFHASRGSNQLLRDYCNGQENRQP